MCVCLCVCAVFKKSLIWKRADDERELRKDDFRRIKKVTSLASFLFLGGYFNFSFVLFQCAMPFLIPSKRKWMFFFVFFPFLTLRWCTKKNVRKGFLFNEWAKYLSLNICSFTIQLPFLPFSPHTHAQKQKNHERMLHLYLACLKRYCSHLFFLVFWGWAWLALCSFDALMKSSPFYPTTTRTNTSIFLVRHNLE